MCFCCGVPWLFVRKICLHCKQLITLRDRSDLSNLSHLEVEVTHGWHERPLFAIINHPVIIPSLYRRRKNSFDLKKTLLDKELFFFFLCQYYACTYAFKSLQSLSMLSPVKKGKPLLPLVFIVKLPFDLFASSFYLFLSNFLTVRFKHNMYMSRRNIRTHTHTHTHKAKSLSSVQHNTLIVKRIWS